MYRIKSPTAGHTLYNLAPAHFSNIISFPLLWLTVLQPCKIFPTLRPSHWVTVLLCLTYDMIVLLIPQISTVGHLFCEIPLFELSLFLPPIQSTYHNACFFWYTYPRIQLKLCLLVFAPWGRDHACWVTISSELQPINPLWICWWKKSRHQGNAVK